MEKEFSRVRSVKDITISLSMIITGCILIALPTSASINTLGFFMICAGIILAFVLKTGYKDIENGEYYIKSEKFFAHGLKSDIASAIEKEPERINLSEENKGNGIRLDIYYSQKNGKAYTQLFEYIPYSYEPCSCIHEHDLNKVSKIIGK